MPARSERQRRLLNARFGHDWVREHGYDNRGKLPEKARKRKGRKQTRSSIKRDEMISQFQHKHGGGRGR